MRPFLVVFDPYLMFFPSDLEGSTTRMVNALIPLRRLTDRGCAILFLHHPSKKSGRRLFGRGNAALHAFVDIDARFYQDPGGLSDRVRRIESKSRIAGANASFRMVLTDDGLDYAPLPQLPEMGGGAEGWTVIRDLVETAGKPLTALELWKGWLEDYPRPALVTLRRWLWLAHAEGRLQRSGSGRCNDPFRFGVKG
jgi:hypothetical protein